MPHNIIYNERRYSLLRCLEAELFIAPLTPHPDHHDDPWTIMIIGYAAAPIHGNISFIPHHRAWGTLGDSVYSSIRPSRKTVG